MTEWVVKLKTLMARICKKCSRRSIIQLEQKWGKRYPMVINSWINNWAEIISQFSIIFEDRLN